MSEKEFELYLSLLSRFLRLKPTQRGEIADELRDHLEARLEELSRTGLSRDDAIHAALEEFGDATELAQHFTQIAVRRKRRFIMRCTVGTVAVLTAGILLTTAFWPANHGVQLPPVAVAEQHSEKKTEAKEVPKKKEESPKRPVVSVKQLRKTSPGEAVVPPRDERFRVAETKLQTRITANFPDVPLAEAIEYLAQLTDVPIHIDRKSISEAGGDINEIINWNLDNHTLETVLDLILEPLQLSYHIQDGIIFIETQEKAANRKEVHIYNCRDLLQGVEEKIEAAAGRRESLNSGGGEGFFDVQDFKPEQAPKPRVSAEKAPRPSGATAMVRLTPEQSLIRVLMHSTNAKWEETDGEGGTITSFDGLLVVRNNQQAQHDVQMVLDMLRAADKQIPARRAHPNPSESWDPRDASSIRGEAPATIPPLDQSPFPQHERLDLPTRPSDKALDPPNNEPEAPKPNAPLNRNDKDVPAAFKNRS